MLRASIDLGTNTCLLLIADWPKNSPEPKAVLGDFSRVVRLGQGVDQSKSLHPEAKARTLACLKDYAAEVKRHQIAAESVICTGTSQARDAGTSETGQSFFSEIERETGFRFQIISGDEEARLTFIGALLPGMDPEKTAVIDIGGGSTEITEQLKGEIHGQSIDVGSVRFTERYLKTAIDQAVTDEQFWACDEAIQQALHVFPKQTEKELIAVAGTATTLAAWHLGLEKFDAKKIDTVTLSRGDLHRMVEELKWRSPKERQSLPGVEPGRADVLLAGALILWRAHEVLGYSRCRISTRGLRYGVLKSEIR